MVTKEKPLTLINRQGLFYLSIVKSLRNNRNLFGYLIAVIIVIIKNR